MIIYKEILRKLKKAGYNTNRLRQENLLSESTIQRLRAGRPITTETIDIICSLTGLDISDLIEYKEENHSSDRKT